MENQHISLFSAISSSFIIFWFIDNKNYELMRIIVGWVMIGLVFDNGLIAECNTCKREAQTVSYAESLLSLRFVVSLLSLIRVSDISYMRYKFFLKSRCFFLHTYPCWKLCRFHRHTSTRLRNSTLYHFKFYLLISSIKEN